MRILLALLLLTAFILAGCAHKEKVVFQPIPGPTSAPASKSATVTPPTAAPIVTPASGLTGKVARYNDAGRFVVIQYPVGHLPSPGQRLFVYRGGLKVGEIKVTGPHRDDYTVADLTVGAAQAGDEVRDR